MGKKNIPLVEDGFPYGQLQGMVVVKAFLLEGTFPIYHSHVACIVVYTILVQVGVGELQLLDHAVQLEGNGRARDPEGISAQSAVQRESSDARSNI